MTTASMVDMCPHGHEFTEENTYRRKARWKKGDYYTRECRTCRNQPPGKRGMDYNVGVHEMSNATHCKQGHEWTEETTQWHTRRMRNGSQKRYRECITCRDTRTPTAKKRQAIRLSQMEVVRQKADVTQPCQRDFCNGRMLLDDYNDPYCNNCGRGTTAILVVAND